MKRRLAVAALLPLALTAANRRPHDPFAGRVAGAPVECIDPKFADGPAIVDQHTIVYNGVGVLYRTGPVGPCPALEPVATLIVRSFGGQLCRNDLFSVLRQGETIPSAPCRFTSFTPYRAPAKAR